MVSETSFKFFIQFVGWNTIYCIFNLIVAAYFLAEYRREVSRLHYFNFQIQALIRLEQKPPGKARKLVSTFITSLG